MMLLWRVMFCWFCFCTNNQSLLVSFAVFVLYIMYALYFLYCCSLLLLVCTFNFKNTHQLQTHTHTLDRSTKVQHSQKDTRSSTLHACSTKRTTFTLVVHVVLSFHTPTRTHPAPHPLCSTPPMLHTPYAPHSLDSDISFPLMQ